MPVDDPASVFTDDPSSLWRLREELHSVPELRWAGLTCPNARAVRVVIAMDPRWDWTEHALQRMRERLGTAAGRQVDVEPIAFNALSRWTRRSDVHSLLTPPDEFEYAPGTMPPVDELELDAMRARHAEVSTGCVRTLRARWRCLTNEPRCSPVRCPCRCHTRS
jgi:hypothetical protein